MSSELLQHVRILDPASNSDRVADVLLQDGLVQAIEPSLFNYPPETTLRDCQGLILGTGLVDLYSHSGEPGFEERETLTSIAAAAIAGGFTRLHLLPDTHPTLDQRATVEYVQSLVKALGSAQTPRIGFWGALTAKTKGEQMTDALELSPVVVGFADGNPLQNLLLLKRILEYAAPLEKPIALVARDLNLANQGSIREGADALRLGLPSVPNVAETAALSALLEVAESTETPIHLMGISTARSVELIAAAKQRGVRITASTGWMHLLLSTPDLYSYDPNLHLEPPLGLPHDQQALRDAIQAGVLDAIAINHQAYTYEEKTVAFHESPPGAIGLELALPLLWDNLVVPGQWSALTLWRSLSLRPAECLQQTPPTLAPGLPLEGCLFDPHLVWEVNAETLRSRSQNTPWFGKPIRGKVIQTWCPR
jgi:dihydroorotase